MKKLTLFTFCLITLSGFAQTKSDSLQITLQQAIEIALNESPNMRIADRTIETKKYYRKEQIVGLFPNVTGAASYQRTLQKQKMVMDFMGQSMEIEVGTSNNMVLSANLSMPIIMPALWNTLKLTSMDIELAVEQARASKIALINNVKKAYYAVLMAQKSYNVLMDNYKNIEGNARFVTDRYNQGLVSEFEKLRADVQVQNAKPNLNAAINAIDISQKALKIYMGVNIHEPLVFTGELKDFETEMEAAKLPEKNSLSLEGNTDLKQMDMTIQQLERSRKIVISGACPMLALSGSYQYMTMGNDIPFNQFNWFPYSVVGVSLQIPIVSWASTAYKNKQIKNNIQNMNDTRLNAERMLWLSVTANLSNIDKALADFESTTESVNMAARAYNIAQKQYEVGMGTWLDLNNAELALLRSQLLYYQSIYDYLVAQAELEYVLGRN
ncbi:MAG: TolC family protein [Bacteroidetes bacterium]|nr:TolC family protein [Bacteroidota bacterium]MCL2303222.1 TolC family protein [Lentimicrobiaceae bacterium]